MQYFLVTLFFAIPGTASAHIFGQAVALPLPVSLFIFGGVAAFIFSALVILMKEEKLPGAPIYGRGISLPASKNVRRGVVAASALLLFSAIFFPPFGDQDFHDNPFPDIFWIGFLLLFTYMNALVGGLWEGVNPLRHVARWAAGSEEKPLPAWLPYLPALFFILLISLELFSYGAGAIPWVLSLTIAGYVVVASIGSAIVGTKNWFSHGDLFSLFFSTVGKLAPFELKEGKLMRSFALNKLSTETPLSLGVLVFILVLLGSTVLDGLRETQIWRDFLWGLESIGIPVANYLGPIFLMLIPAILFVLYTLAIYAMQKFTSGSHSLRELLLCFSYSLIPIAVAYHFAHYFSLILQTGEMRFPIVPFELVRSDYIWYVQLGTILLGHIFAALIAHRVATSLFKNRREVIISQLPMLFLMVLYTLFGLWALSQPFAAIQG